MTKKAILTIMVFAVISILFAGCTKTGTQGSPREIANQPQSPAQPVSPAEQQQSSAGDLSESDISVEQGSEEVDVSDLEVPSADTAK